MPAGPAGDRSRPTLAERLAERIRSGGPIPVSEYVEAALYDPEDGFFMAGGRAGRSSGDFLTAPEVGGLFGAVLARAVDSWWADLGSPDPFVVVDLGAGPGTLVRSVLAAEPDALRVGAMRCVAVEPSVAQRALHPRSPVVDSLDQMPDLSGPTVVLANEVLDNVPFDVVQRTSGGWCEVRVGFGPDAGFELVEGPACRPGLGGFDPEVGTRVPLQSEARRLVDDVCRRVPRGRLVVVDYGADTETLARRPDMGWLRSHRRHDDRGSWLDDPGSRDITVDVAVDQITSERSASRLSTQAEFLRRHGIDELVEHGMSVWAERAHIGDLAALQGRSRISEAEALLDPDGMGGFFVAEWIL